MSSLPPSYWKIGAIIGGVSAATAFSFLYYLGAFRRIAFRRNANVGPYLLIYRQHIGPYKSLAPIVEQVRKIVEQDLGIQYESGFGIYFDDPQVVKQSKLRSYIGKIIDPKYNDDESFKSKAENAGLKLLYIPATVATLSTFPLRSDFSYAMGAKKVYTAAKKLRIEPKCGVLEIYSCNTDGSTITYIFPDTNIEYFTFVNFV